MPITVSWPTGTPLAPGMMPLISWTEIGPPPPGSTLFLQVWPSGVEAIGAAWHWPIGLNGAGYPLDQQHLDDGRWFTDIPPSSTVTIKTSIASGAGTFATGTQNGVSWDKVGALPNLLEQSAGSAGLTDTQQQQLEETHAAVITEMSVGGTPSLIDIASIIAHPPLGLMAVSAGSAPQSGDGTVPPPPGDVISRFGLIWAFTVIPPYLGRTLLGLPAFTFPMLQLRVVHTIRGVDFYSQVEDFNRDNVIWLFNEALPTRIEYSILPGVQVQFNWLY